MIVTVHCSEECCRDAGAAHLPGDWRCLLGGHVEAEEVAYACPKAAIHADSARATG